MVLIIISIQHCYFNPRSREGSDKIDLVLCLREKAISIHAPARGATLGGGKAVSKTDISIHAPARGATGLEVADKAINKISIHAPARGATVDKNIGSTIKVISIHAPARGATVLHFADK